MTNDRARFVQFSAPVLQHVFSIAIKNDLSSSFDPLMFWSPLATEVWLVLVAFTLMPSFLMSLQDVLIFGEEKSFGKFFMRLLSAFSSNYGGNFLAQGSNRSHRAMIAAYFFNGLIIWIAFRSSMTAILSQKKIQLPFNNMESLSQTSYLLTTQKSGFEADTFLEAKAGSVEKKVLDNNMNDQESFIGLTQGTDFTEFTFQ